MFDNLSLFIDIVDCGSYSKASSKLGLYQSKISRKMKTLEDALGTKLFKKNTPKMEITDSGTIAYKMFKNLFTTLENRLNDFNALNKKICGEVKVILPPSFAKLYINERISKFLAKYPEIKLKLLYLTASEGDLDFFDNYDLMISYKRPNKPYQILKTLFETKLILVGSKKYVQKYGEIKDINSLTSHKITTIDQEERQLSAYNEKDDTSQKICLDNGGININCWNAALDLLKLGNTITFVPECEIKAEIDSGEIIRLLPDFHFGTIKYYLVQTNHNTSTAQEVVKEFLYDCILQNPSENTKKTDNPPEGKLKLISSDHGLSNYSNGRISA